MKIQKWDEINGTGSSDKKMEAFLSSETDTYAILQLRYTEETAYERFESMEGLRRQGKQPDIDHYEVVYIGPLLPYKDLNTMLEQTYEKFSIGFRTLPEFLKPENYLKNAEMSMEDDYGMIDGIVNNGKADRIKEAEEQRPSVLEQLKAGPAALEHPEKIRKPEERNIG